MRVISDQPAEYTQELWNYVESDGSISRMVWVDRDQQGNIFRKIARVGATQVDLLSGTAMEDASFLAYQLQPDRLPEYILNGETQNGAAYQGQQVNWRGAPSTGQPHGNL